MPPLGVAVTVYCFGSVLATAGRVAAVRVAVDEATDANSL